MSIAKTKEAIDALPEDAGSIYWWDLRYENTICSGTELKALADSHTRLLEAAKDLEYWSGEHNIHGINCPRCRLLSAIAEVEKAT